MIFRFLVIFVPILARLRRGPGVPLATPTLSSLACVLGPAELALAEALARLNSP